MNFRSPTSTLPLYFSIIILCVSIFVYFVLLHDASPYGPEYIPYGWVNSQVPKIQVTPDDDFAKRISSIGEPIILQNTVVEKWAARKLWTPEYIMKHTSSFERVQCHPDKTFSYFHSNHPMSNLPGVSDNYKKGTYQQLNLTSEEFFLALNRTPPYHYYAGNADTLGRIYNDLYPIEFLMVRNSTWKLEESHLHRWTNVWIGPPGATTHTHYDISHNFYVQLYGRKRFILWPPSQLNTLYLYPFLHPGAQQSQVRLDGPMDLQSFPNFANTEAIEAILEPGDVLYLPPLWFHHVTALSLSISVSVWTRFPETQYMHQTVRAPLPFRSSWPKNKLLLAGRIYMETLLNTILRDEERNALDFVRNIVEQRFHRLFDQFPLFTQSFGRYCTDRLLPATEEEIIKEMEGPFATSIEYQAQLFAKEKNPFRRDIWLGNLCEQLALTVANLQDVGSFLHDFYWC